MSKTTKVLLGVIIAAVIIIGVAYAAVAQIDLQIAGSAEAIIADDNFDVCFVSEADGNTMKTTVTENVGGSNKAITATPTISADPNDKSRKATLEVSGFDVVGDEIEATYIIKNNSIAATDAILSVDVKGAGEYASNFEEYFEISDPVIADPRIGPTESTTVTFTVKLARINVNNAEHKTEFTVDLKATPAQ